MHSSGWIPRTFEDRLLASYYFEAPPGLLFLEVEVGRGSDNRPRWLDGLLIPGGAGRVRSQGTFNRADIAAAVQGQHVHLLEADQKLSRTVIGQVQVGVALLKRDFKPASVQGVAVCALGNPDLEWYCREQGIRTALYPMDLPRCEAGIPEGGPVDKRKPPSANSRQAFMMGWDAAVAGRLFNTVHAVKTHENMGNMFGWIYGDKPEWFRQETWEKYVESLDAA